MGAAPFYPSAFDQVNAWLQELGATAAERRAELELGDRSAVWRLAVDHMVLDGTHPLLVLTQAFPAAPARIVFGSTLCLHLPHVEEDGNFCHGLEPQGDDFENPKAAVGRVLERLDKFLNNCVEPGWREAEFQRERLNYWNRWVTLANRPAAYLASELLLDATPGQDEVHVLHTVLLAGNAKAFASSAGDKPEALAKERGWTVGTITRGATLVVPIAGEISWTPNTWPKAFAVLNAFASSQVDEQDLIGRWYRSKKWPNKAPVFVVLQQGTFAFAWCLVPNPIQRGGEPTILPVTVTRVDRNWALARDRAPEQLAQRTARRVVLLGAGSLGSAVAELLVRAGVGVDVVDPEDFESENTSRHLLGMPDLGKSKALTLAARLKKNVPAANVRGFKQSAAKWAALLVPAETPDLVVDCTGERGVRLMLSQLRTTKLRGVPVVMSWMEPLGAAAHVVIMSEGHVWPTSDPTDTHINIAQWPDSVYVSLPACGQGFHEYGVADAWAAAALAAEKTLLALDAKEPASGVWSRIRNRSFFEAAAPGVVFNREVPCLPNVECIVEHRSLAEALVGCS